MINMVFSKMEAYSGSFGQSLAKLQQRNSFVHHKHTTSLDDGSSSGDQSVKHSEKSLKVKRGQSLSVEEEKSDVYARGEGGVPSTHQSQTSASAHHQTQVSSSSSNVVLNVSAIDQYVF